MKLLSVNELLQENTESNITNYRSNVVTSYMLFL